jgi:uncharacterized Zn finger protein (UPF0148 family)
MEIVKCLSCGSPQLVKQDGYYVCPFCRTNYQDQDEREFIEKLNRMVLLFDDKRYSDAHSLSVEILSKQPNNTLAEYYRALSHSTFDSVICLEDDAEALQKALLAYQQQVGSSSSYFIFAANQARAFIAMASYVAARHSYGRVTTTIAKKPSVQTEPDNDVSGGVALGTAAGAAVAAHSAIKMVTGSSILGALGGAAAGVIGGAVGGTVGALSKAGKSRSIPEVPQPSEVIVTVRQGEMDKIAKWLIGAVHILYKPINDMSQAVPYFFAVQIDLLNLAEQLGGNQNLSLAIGNTRAFIAANQRVLAAYRAAPNRDGL